MSRFPKLLNGLFREFRNSYNEGVDKIDEELDLQKQRVDRLITENPQPSEVVDARGNHPVLGDRFNSVESHLAQNATKINFFINVEELGAVSDCNYYKSGKWYKDSAYTQLATDNTNIIKSIIANAPQGSRIEFPGRYLMTQELVIDKPLILCANNSGWANGSYLAFDKCNGINLKHAYSVVEDLMIFGTGKNASIDIDNNNFGTVGLKYERNDSMTLGGGLDDKNVRIHGFNIGLGLIASGAETWTGAYREHYGMKLHYNDIGFLSIGGSTHERFFGGVISNNSKHGVYADSKTSYSNIEFIGTTIEANGFNGDMASTSRNYGIVAVGEKTKLKLTNGYIEHQTQYAKDGANIQYESSYVRAGTRHFASGGGSILQNKSLAPYDSKIVFGNDLATSFTYTKCTATNVQASNRASHVRVTSTESTGIPTMTKSIYQRTLQGKDVEWIKFSCKVKVNSGKNAPGFKILPYFRIDAADGTRDSYSENRTSPLAIYDYSRKPYETIEFYYDVRAENPYLNPDSLLSLIYFGIYFSGTSADYSVENLDVEILDPYIEFFTRSLGTYA